ncbi:MAG: hypothetical protein ABSD46_04880 [Bacteroidota bacterium]
MQSHLIDNGLDFIVRAASDLVSDDLVEEHQVKYSTIELYEGIELLLKARLAQEHWSLVVRDVDKYKRDSLEKGTFISVNFGTICDRLLSFCNVALDDGAYQSFDQLRSLRNRYIHFSCKESHTAVIAIQLKAWHHILRMLEEGFLGEFNEDQIQLLNEAQQLMLHSDEYLDTRFGEVQSQIVKADVEGLLVAKCPMCGKPSLIIGDGSPACPVCGIKEIDPAEAANEYALMNNSFWMHPKHGPDDEVGICDECDSEAVVPIGDDLREKAEKILLRHNKREPGEDWEISICFSCGDLTIR